MKGFLFLALFCIIAFTQISCGQTKSVEKNTQSNTSNSAEVKNEGLKKLITETQQAFSNNDFVKFSNLIFVPNDIVKNAPEEAKKFREQGLMETKQQLSQAREQGFDFEVKFSEPKEIIKSEKNMSFSFISTKSIIRIGKDSQARDLNGNIIKSGRYETDGYELAVSEDNGQNWHWWRGKEDFFKMLYPEAAKKVVFPAKQMQPTYYPE
jgi:hypothetical protein